jgi:membrane-bound lytic murein transglycosylase D
VYKAIKLSGSRDFWKLQRYLPKESRDHVKRFIATHFYYEEKGSTVTLTKAERNAYFATLKDIAIPVEKNEEQNSTPASPKQPVNWVLMAQHDGELLFVLRK